jgi:hypothetical protein
MCNGTFQDKDPNEAIEYLDLLAENAQNWDTACNIPHFWDKTTISCQ